MKGRIHITRVSVQGVKSLGGHFACLCRGFDFYEVKKNIYYYFSKRKGKYFYTFNHNYREKSSKRANSTITYYEPQFAGINLQSPQSDSTPRRLTLQITHYRPLGITLLVNGLKNTGLVKQLL